VGCLDWNQNCFLSSVNVDDTPRESYFESRAIALSNVNGILAINTIREDLVACVLEDDNAPAGIRWQNVRNRSRQ
jgi:hypothetical protein